MNRLPVEWLSSPGDEEKWPEEGYEMHFRLTEEWVAVDADQLVMPIAVIAKTGISVEDPYPALLKQYGGEGLLNDMLMSEQDLEAGSEWYLLRHENLLTIEPASTDD